MSLVRSDVTWWRATSTSRRTSPENLVCLLMPWVLVVIYLLNSHSDRIPPIGIPARGRVVIMARNEYIAESLPLCRREHGVQDVNRPPVGEEVSLLVARPRVIAKIEFVVYTRSEFEVVIYVTWEACCLEKVLWYLALMELCAQGCEEPAGLRGWRASESVGFPNI